jgi:calcineurin-like phosphoesterase family protein
MNFFTADEHYGHNNIIKFCNRPFNSTHEMNKTIIANHNSRVTTKDTTYHIGDFTTENDPEQVYRKFIHHLNGSHIFVKGSHDKWLRKTEAPYLIEKAFGEHYLVLCHYAMRKWPRSHYGALNLFGHSHGKLDEIYPGQKDIGVDTHGYHPYSLDDIIKHFACHSGLDVKHH